MRPLRAPLGYRGHSAQPVRAPDQACAEALGLISRFQVRVERQHITVSQIKVAQPHLVATLDDDRRDLSRAE